jgi:hypothetical protein
LMERMPAKTAGTAQLKGVMSRPLRIYRTGRCYHLTYRVLVDRKTGAVLRHLTFRNLLPMFDLSAERGELCYAFSDVRFCSPRINCAHAEGAASSQRGRTHRQIRWRSFALRAAGLIRSPWMAEHLQV